MGSSQSVWERNQRLKLAEYVLEILSIRKEYVTKELKQVKEDHRKAVQELSRIKKNSKF